MKVTSAGWQVTLCDPIWHVISRSGVVISITNCYIRVYFTFTLRVTGTSVAALFYFVSQVCTAVIPLFFYHPCMFQSWLLQGLSRFQD